jgi:hypothetical protein
MVEVTASAIEKSSSASIDPSKIPFVLRRVAGAWRVEPEPSFL